MLSAEALKAYREMTPGQRLGLTLEAMRDSTAHLVAGPPEIVDRRFALIRRNNDECNRLMLLKLAQAECRDEGS